MTEEPVTQFGREVADPSKTAWGRQAVEEYRRRGGPRLQAERAQIINWYFRTFVNRLGAVRRRYEKLMNTGPKDWPPGAPTWESKQRLAEDHRYWISTQTGRLWEKFPWLRLIGKPPVMREWPDTPELPTPVEAGRAFDEIQDRVFELDAILGWMERESLAELDDLETYLRDGFLPGDVPEEGGGGPPEEDPGQTPGE
ncbi:MAG: hypothetical protein LBG06_06145 [Deltaproteobacteria bacterium]|jgi:hypothetical protein|nr:hypothetical protein [Deltaproteobacteria bacterium]